MAQDQAVRPFPPPWPEPLLERGAEATAWGRWMQNQYRFLANIGLDDLVDVHLGDTAPYAQYKTLIADGTDSYDAGWLDRLMTTDGADTLLFSRTTDGEQRLMGSADNLEVGSATGIVDVLTASSYLRHQDVSGQQRLTAGGGRLQLASADDTVDMLTEIGYLRADDDGTSNRLYSSGGNLELEASTGIVDLVTAAGYARLQDSGANQLLYFSRGTSILRSGGDVFSFQEDDGTELLELAATGATFNAAFTLPAADGTINQILATDGAGTVTWKSLGAGVTVDMLTSAVGAGSTLTLTDAGAGTDQTLIGSLGSTYMENQDGDWHFGDTSDQYTSIRHNDTMDLSGFVGPDSYLRFSGTQTEREDVYVRSGVWFWDLLGGAFQVAEPYVEGYNVTNDEAYFWLTGASIAENFVDYQFYLGDGTGARTFSVDPFGAVYTSGNVSVGLDTDLTDYYGIQSYLNPSITNQGAYYGGTVGALETALNIYSYTTIDQGPLQYINIYGMSNTLNFEGTGNISLGNIGALNSTVYLDQDGQIGELEGSITGFIFQGANDTTVDYLVGFLMGVFEAAPTGTKHINYCYDTFVSPFGLASTTIDERVGIKIGDISGDATTTFGIDSATSSLMRDDCAWVFGDSSDASILHDTGDGASSLRINTDNLLLVDSTSQQPKLHVRSLNPASDGAQIILEHFSASPEDGDGVGTIYWRGYNNAGTPEDTIYAQINVKSTDVSDGTECGWLELLVHHDGGGRNVLQADGDLTTPVITIGSAAWDSVLIDNNDIQFGADSTADVKVSCLGGTTTGIMYWRDTDAYFEFDDATRCSNGLRVTGGFFGLGEITELTVSAGAITAIKSIHKIDTQDDDATDDLDTINGGSEGDMLFLRSVSAARDTTLKDGTGNLSLAGDFTLTNASDWILLINVGGTSWAEISRSDNA